MEFIPKDLAIKLKEKGFDKPCFGWYYIESIDEEVNLNENFGTYEDCLYSNNLDDFRNIDIVDRIDAPTIEQVLEWLRDTKYIHFNILPYNYQVGIMYTSLSICQVDPNGKFGMEEKFIYKAYETYDDACIACIEYVVKCLI